MATAAVPTDYQLTCCSMTFQLQTWNAKPPRMWSKDDVRDWLDWCLREYELSDVKVDKFNMNGKALCMLTKENFCDRAPNAGDVLFNTLHGIIDSTAFISPEPYAPLDLRQTSPPMPLTPDAIHPAPVCKIEPETMSPREIVPAPHDSRMDYSHNSSAQSDSTPWPLNLKVSATTVAAAVGTPTVPTTQTSPHDVQIFTYLPSVQHSVQYLDPEHKVCKQLPAQEPGSSCCDQPTFVYNPEVPNLIEGQEIYHPVTRGPPPLWQAPHLESGVVSNSSSDCRLLWEFITELLADDKYQSYICWEDQENWMFRIVDQNGLAALWGKQKNRNNMTYEKFSRALRYYYKQNIISKVPGRKMTYRFLTPPHKIKKGVRGAKPGVPHHRRMPRQPATTTAIQSTTSSATCDVVDDVRDSDSDSGSLSGEALSTDGQSEESATARSEEGAELSVYECMQKTSPQTTVAREAFAREEASRAIPLATSIAKDQPQMEVTEDNSCSDANNNNNSNLHAGRKTVIETGSALPASPKKPEAPVPKLRFMSDGSLVSPQPSVTEHTRDSEHSPCQEDARANPEINVSSVTNVQTPRNDVGGCGS